MAPTRIKRGLRCAAPPVQSPNSPADQRPWRDPHRRPADRRAPHRVVAYLKDLARDLHGFYHRCRVVGEAPEVQAFRMELTVATRDVVRRGLDLVGVTAPDRM